MTESNKRQRVTKNTMAFTDLGIRRLNVRKRLDQVNAERRKRHREQGRPISEFKPVKQDLIWDAAQKGLSLLISAGGTMTFRATYKLNGEYKSVAFGRFGELVPDADPNKENVQIGAAREIVRDYRAKAKKGIDPLASTAKAQKHTYEAVLNDFIEHYAKPRQRTWPQTERVLRTCCPDWLKRPMDEITRADVRSVLRGFIANGHGPKAANARRWLLTLWRWAYEEERVSAPVIEAVKIDYEKKERDRVYTDNEIKAIWNAAEQCDPEEAAYVKLLVLLAPRKTALAALRRQHLDDVSNPTLWKTPFELMKVRKSSSRKSTTGKPREYQTPLPSLAQRILKSALARTQDDRIFPGLRVHLDKGGILRFTDKPLRRKLIAHGAPADLFFHAVRHTCGTFLQSKSFSEWECSLVLNHSSGSVTGDYLHSHAIERKREVLKAWSDHVEKLVAPKGAALLR